MWHFFEGRAFDKSTVSSSGVAPAGTPFFCNRKAIMLMEFFASFRHLRHLCQPKLSPQLPSIRWAVKLRGVR
jgi:hypothetical protein